jgi:hypothetical protein
MGGQAKRESGGAPTPDRNPNDQPCDHSEQAAPDYVVARGRSVYIEGKSYGPGSPVELPDAQLKHLLQAGFIAPSVVEPTAAVGVRVGGLQIRGGRKPGAHIA